LQGDASGGGSGGGDNSGSSSLGTGRRAGGGGDRGGRGHANSHVSDNERGGYDARHRVKEVRGANKTTDISDSNGFPA
jgi:hypothetical protein